MNNTMYRLWYWFGKNGKWNYNIYRIWKSIGMFFGWDKRLEKDDYYKMFIHSLYES
tara:strand:+ start:2354 stop:2521 length:168 start_codon:yes stop_codon:yes gene_type:complete